MARKLTKNLTPEEQKEQSLKDLDAQRRRILREYAFQNINSLPDLYKHMGVTLPEGDVYPYLELPISKDVINDWFSSKKELIEKGELPSEQPVVTDEPKEPELLKEVQEEIPKLRSLFENPHVIYQPFQNKAAYRILKAIRIHKRKGILLQAPVGVGKTFILGAIIRELIDSKWEPIQEGICFSPYPIVYITKATIVEQTIRVLEDKFGLIIGTDVDVTTLTSYVVSLVLSSLKRKRLFATMKNTLNIFGALSLHHG